MFKITKLPSNGKILKDETEINKDEWLSIQSNISYKIDSNYLLKNNSDSISIQMMDLEENKSEAVLTINSITINENQSINSKCIANQLLNGFSSNSVGTCKIKYPSYLSSDQ